MSKGNLVSIVDQMMKDGAGINQIQAVIEEVNAQEERIEQNAAVDVEPKKEQDPQATDAPVESTPSDTDLASEDSLPESQYVSDVADPTPVAPEFKLDEDVYQMIRS